MNNLVSSHAEVEHLAMTLFKDEKNTGDCSTWSRISASHRCGFREAARDLLKEARRQAIRLEAGMTGTPE